MKINKKLKVVLFLFFFLPSCTPLKKYHPPQVQVEPTWKNQSDQHLSNDAPSPLQIESSYCQAIELLNNWWEIFNDPLLNQLQEESLKDNYDLKAAFQRVLQARNLAKMSRSLLYPEISFSPQYLRNQMLILSPLSLSSLANTNAATTDMPNQSSLPNSDLPNNVLRFLNSQYLLPFNFQYEVDLWNKLHSASKAAYYREQAVAQDYYQVLLSLTSALATHYFHLRDLDFQYQIVTDTLQTRKKALEINLNREEVGMITHLDVSRAKVQVFNAESDLVEIQRLRAVEQNIIATLTGRSACDSSFYLSFHPLKRTPPKIPIGFPSDILLRRPDILAAQNSLAAAYAEIGVAYADFFPSLNLSIGLGLESPITSLLFNWKARMWQVAASALQKVFDAGRTQASVDLAKARFHEQINLYYEMVLKAFEEVENALVNLKEYANQTKVLAESIKYAEQTRDLSYFRYHRGLVSYLDVTDAERELLQARQNYALAIGHR